MGVKASEKNYTEFPSHFATFSYLRDWHGFSQSVLSTCCKMNRTVIIISPYEFSQICETPWY